MFAQFYEIYYQPACLHQSGMSLVQLPERKMPREITQIKVCQTEPTPDRGENQLRGGHHISSSQSGIAAGCGVKTLLCPRSDKIRLISKSAQESWLEKKPRLTDADFYVWSEADQSFRG